MVYCTKCGTKNEDEAAVCKECGSQFQISKPARKRRSNDECFGPRERRQMDNECFGLPYGGAIAGLVFGIIIILVGLAIFTGLQIWDYLGPAIMVIVGVLIIAGALYGLRRR